MGDMLDLNKRDALATIKAALRAARDFAEEEVDMRGYAGSGMSDYQGEAEDVLERCTIALAILETWE
jgi:hypothetical protein